jgi:MFS family permease
VPRLTRWAGRWSWLPPSVWLLGWISLLTDTASEAIYPLLPLFLTSILGARPVVLGVIEGIAEATSSILRIAAGALSDRQGRRPWVIAGYTLSSLVRPAMSLVGGWGQVLALRFVDRMGKGVRGAPRDALLASWAPPDARGRVFGFHRAMDHAGAVLGPAAAALFLWIRPGAYRLLFALTILPGLAVLVLLARLPRDAGREGPPARASATSPIPDRRAPREPLPAPFYRALAVIGLFTLGNSTDTYLLLRLGELTGSAALVPLAWAALHVVKSSTSVFGGWMADRVGRRGAIGAGWLLYAAVYLAFALAGRAEVVWAAFLLYGVYFGLTEGAEKALIADWTPPSRRGTAFGYYNAVLGVGALVASIGFGLIWEAWGAATAFTAGAALAATATPLLWVAIPARPPHAARSA